MKTKKSFMVNVSGKKCTCFKVPKLGILKNGLGAENSNVLGHYYSINTFYRCRNYLLKYFNNTYGKIWSDKRRSGQWNYENNPVYLKVLSETKDWMNKFNWLLYWKDQNKKLFDWIKNLPIDQLIIIQTYWLLLNSAVK